MGFLAHFYRPGGGGFELFFAWGVGNSPTKKIARGGWSGLELTDTYLKANNSPLQFLHLQNFTRKANILNFGHPCNTKELITNNTRGRGYFVYLYTGVCIWRAKFKPKNMDSPKILHPKILGSCVSPTQKYG